MYSISVPTLVLVVLYCVATAAPQVVVRGRLRARTSLAAPSERPAEQVDAYQLAYLNGGPPRVGLAAIAALLFIDVIWIRDSGGLRLSSAHESSPHSPVEAPTEWAVVHLLRRRAPAHTPDSHIAPSAWSVSQSMYRDPVVRRIGADLAERGLILSPDWISRRTWYWCGYYLSLFGLGCLLLATGDFYYPDVRDVLYCVALAPMLYCGYSACSGLPLPSTGTLTAAGRAAVAAARRQPTPSAAYAVALDGPAGYPDSRLRELLAKSNTEPPG